MNRMVSAGLAALIVVLQFASNKTTEAFIQFENTTSAQTVVPVVQRTQSKSLELLQSLERISCLQLEIRDRYLRLKAPTRLPLLYASLSAEYQVEQAVHADRRCSSTARELLLSSIRSANVYKIRENSDAALGRVATNDYIELDFGDFGEIIYRDIPREVFDVGMIFMHELAHRHLKLTDPTKESIKADQFVKGDTVKFINRIERELGLPERRHYSPVKIRYIRNEFRWGIYFGNGTDRVEMDQRFAVR